MRTTRLILETWQVDDFNNMSAENKKVFLLGVLTLKSIRCTIVTSFASAGNPNFLTVNYLNTF
jgi:hypothetical protein